MSSSVFPNSVPMTVSAGRDRGPRLSRETVSVRAAFQLALVVAISIWAACDPAFETMGRSLKGMFWSPLDGFRETARVVGIARPIVLLVLLAIAATSFLRSVSAMASRSVRSLPYRTVRSSVWLVTIAAVWFALAVNYPAIAWQGKRLRLAFQLDELESLAQPLRQQWPAEDGELERLGPYMAYPFGNPTTLILLQPQRVSANETFVSTVQRGDGGALRFELNGTDGGDWAEWHPESSRPVSFVGGLSDRHELQSALPLGSGWYLVRYRS